MNNSRPKAKLSRALGIPLTPKCVKYFEKRPFPPGVHGRGRRKASDYQVRLLEKQRLRHQYNISEAQMRHILSTRQPAKPFVASGLPQREIGLMTEQEAQFVFQ